MNVRLSLTAPYEPPDQAFIWQRSLPLLRSRRANNRVDIPVKIELKNPINPPIIAPYSGGLSPPQKLITPRTTYATMDTESPLAAPYPPAAPQRKEYQSKTVSMAPMVSMEVRSRD